MVAQFQLSGNAPASRPDVQTIRATLRCDNPRCACQRPGGKKSHCPAHRDQNPSLDVTERDGRVLVICRAGCPQRAVIEALKHKGAWPSGTDRAERRRGQQAAPKESGHTAAIHGYRDADGRLLATHRRILHPNGTKQMPWVSATGEPVKPSALPLYRLPELLAAPADADVLLVEGEKCADAARAAGYVAVSLAGGAEQRDFGQALDPLRGRQVFLMPDNDAPGRGLMQHVGAALTNIAADVRVVELPDLPEKGDIADYLADGHTADDVRAAMAAAPTWADWAAAIACYPVPTAANTALPSFPVDVLPAIVRQVVEAGARALGAPSDFIAVPLLVFAGAVLGHGHAIELKPGFVQRPILYAAVVGQPGSAKSPALDLARYPLDQLQGGAFTAYQQAYAQHKADLASWLETRRADGDAGPRPEPPMLESFFSTDATLESIAPMLTSQAHGVVMIRDELVGWVKACDAYRGGRGGDRQAWLSLWAGTPIKVDRKTGEPIFVPEPVVCVVGGVQPDVLSDLAAEAGRRDGFVERILFSYPEAEPAPWTDEGVPQDLKDRLVELFRQSGAMQPDRPVTLSAEAKGIWRDWYDENQRLTADASGLMQGVYAKLPLQVARLALILHRLTQAAAISSFNSFRSPHGAAGGRLSGDTMTAAITLAEYFRAHAHRALAHVGATGLLRQAGVAVRALRLLRAAGGEWLAKSALYSKLGGHVSATALDAALAELAAQSLAASRTQSTGARGRPAEEWRAITAPERNEINEENAGTGVALRCAHGVERKPGISCVQCGADRPACVGGMDAMLEMAVADEGVL